LRINLKRLNEKTILTLMLVVVSSSAMAEWVKGGGDAENTFDVYYDPTTIRKSGNKVKMWVLFDYKVAQKNAGKLLLSIKGQSEYECKEEQIRVIYEAQYSKNMGTGQLVSSFSDPNDWIPVMPESIDKEMWKIACGK
jgi:hypothetical protein